MILHTVIPEEFVLAGLGHGVGEAVWWPAPAPAWPGGPAGPSGAAGSAAGQLERAAAGASGPVRVLIDRDAAGGWRISRLLSSDPNDFLNPDFAPGRSVTGPLA